LAVNAFKKAADDATYRTPSNAYNNLGSIYFKKGDYQNAVKSYNKALELFPSFSLCYRNLGLVYEKTGKDDEAVKAYKQAISFSPDYAVAHFYLGKLYHRLNKRAEASKELKKSVELDPAAPFADEAERLLKDQTIKRMPN